ncbi:MAG: hypothetical protein WCC60_19475 [Ilumatobacteraceae bacterium]
MADLRAAASQLAAEADHLDGAAGALTRDLGGLRWLGDVAVRFSDVWNSGHKQHMAVTAGFLRENSERLLRQAEEQDQASNSTGGFTMPGRLPVMPTLPLDPRQPGEPVMPLTPIEPGGPVHPFDPQPVLPFMPHPRPFDPADPVLPPKMPVNLVEPVGPFIPLRPMPHDPVLPFKPGDPGLPIEPRPHPRFIGIDDPIRIDDPIVRIGPNDPPIEAKPVEPGRYGTPAPDVLGPIGSIMPVPFPKVPAPDLRPHVSPADDVP